MYKHIKVAHTDRFTYRHIKGERTEMSMIYL